VKAYLVSKGITEDRITVEGYGDTMPVGDNSSAAGRTKNRRVEIKVNY
jgi:outer membrane protein OmpA-like peptidoglycan-associated protein